LESWLRGVRRVVSSRGRSIQSATRQRGRDAEFLAAVKPLVIGPTGNLRAPTLLAGDLMIVGFHEDVYRQELL
jgi:hypothetical protein